MDWFERLTGFPEGGYDATRKRLAVGDGRLRSLVNGRSYGIGDLELVSLGALRDRARQVSAPYGSLTLHNVTGDVRAMHKVAQFEGALFQVASQFNLLEMISPAVTPEHGVTRYEHDRTQGPACALAAGAATIYRNYFAPIGAEYGQTADRQFDGLANIGAALSAAVGQPTDWLWSMRNGYALCSADGLATIDAYLRQAKGRDTDQLRSLLQIGVHRDVQVTDQGARSDQYVSQAFCSALPVAYTGLARPLWRPFAELVLEAAYEATLWAGVLNAARGTSNIVLLTRLGGGAFGNDDIWIDMAMRRALEQFRNYELDVRLVSYGLPPASMVDLERDFS